MTEQNPDLRIPEPVPDPNRTKPRHRMLQPPRIPLPNLANKRSYTPVCPGFQRISPVVRSSWRFAVPLLASAFSAT